MNIGDILFFIIAFQSTFLNLSIIFFTFMISYNIFFTLGPKIKNILKVLAALNIMLSFFPKALFLLRISNYGNKINLLKEIINTSFEIILILFLLYIIIIHRNKKEEKYEIK